MDEIGTQVSGYAIAGGVGTFTLAVLRLAYGSMKERTSDLKDRIHELEHDRDYWRTRATDGGDHTDERQS